jgi:hypothetical protein
MALRNLGWHSPSRSTDEQASLADVARGRADLRLITINDIRTRSPAAGADLRPVVTFGARRSPL